MEQRDRYCRNCGQRLLREDRFCAGCGRSVVATAFVPTPEADVSVPPLTTPDEGSVSTPEHQPTSLSRFRDHERQSHQPGLWNQIKRPVFWFVGSLIVAGVMSAAADSMAGGPGMTGAETVGFFLGEVIFQEVTKFVAFGTLLLGLGGFFYVFALLLGKRPHFLQVLFDWQLMVVIVILVLLSGLFLA